MLVPDLTGRSLGGLGVRYQEQHRIVGRRQLRQPHPGRDRAGVRFKRANLVIEGGRLVRGEKADVRRLDGPFQGGRPFQGRLDQHREVVQSARDLSVVDEDLLQDRSHLISGRSLSSANFRFGC